MYRYAYLVGIGILAIFWLWFFLKRKDLRKQQLFLSFLLVPFAPTTDIIWFYHDYWRPEYIVSIKINSVPIGIESLLFAFFIGGIAGIAYETVFKKRHVYGKQRNILTVVIIIFGILVITVLKILGLNTIWASSIALIIAAVTMMLIDRDIILDAITSGVLLLVISIILYITWLTIYPEAINKFWVIDSLSGIKLWKIPIEELMWFFAVGLSGGVLYEFWLNAEKYLKLK